LLGESDRRAPARSGTGALELPRNALVAATPRRPASGSPRGGLAAPKSSSLRPAWQAAQQGATAFNAVATATADAAGAAAAGAAAHAAGMAGAASTRRRGAGIACMWYGIGNTVIANPSTMRGSLRLGDDGRAHLLLYNGAQEIGQGTATIMRRGRLPTRWALPLPAASGVMGDTDRTADAGKSSASRRPVSGRAARGRRSRPAPAAARAQVSRGWRPTSLRLTATTRSAFAWHRRRRGSSDRAGTGRRSATRASAGARERA
jgi:hypothetical protein